MGTQYSCKKDRRLQAVREHATLNAIDYLEVLDHAAIPLGSPRQRTLLVRCVKPLDPATDRDNVEIAGGVRVTNVEIEWARTAALAGDLFAEGLVNTAERDYFLALDDPDQVLVVRTSTEGDFSPYRLCLVTGDAPLAGFDPPLAEVVFTFKVECPSDFDCAPAPCPPELLAPPPHIDYLAKDFASFRRLLLDRMAELAPQWTERSPADQLVALAEAIAFQADRLSHMQDAVFTDTYLGTSRLRPSVRRHGRLLDYRLHEGTNARVWLHFEVSPTDVNVPLQQSYTRPVRIVNELRDVPTLLTDEMLRDVRQRERVTVFELLQPGLFFGAHNEIGLYTWGDEACCLPKGATRATLLDDEANRLALRAGDLLLFEEVKGTTGDAADAERTHRQVVRLTRVVPEATLEEDGTRTPGPLQTDALFDQPIVEVEWSVDDALTFPLCLSTEDIEAISVARGNILLADHGETLPNVEVLEPSGDTFEQIDLAEPHLVHREPWDETRWKITDPTQDAYLSARSAMDQDARAALAAIEVESVENVQWAVQWDLLESDRFATDFVVEMHENRRAHLRFGDNVHGEIPQEILHARYRVGEHFRGEVGADRLRHLVVPAFVSGILNLRNPLAASPTKAPEAIREVKHYAPVAFRWQDRAVTEEGYAEVMARHPEVVRAAAQRRWTGSWHTMFIAVDRAGGLEIDDEFEDELRHWLRRYKLAGHDVEIEPPLLVPLDIAIHVCVEPGVVRAGVHEELLDVFSSRVLPNGDLGFFHPDRLTFGTDIFLSAILARAMEIPGVMWVDIDPTADPPGRFQRFREEAHDEIAEGVLSMDAREIPLLDNDPSQPENGVLEFHMEGGL